MQTIRLALIGFGNVGQGLTEIIADRNDNFAKQFGLKFQIVAVSDIYWGSVYDPDGLDPVRLLGAIQKGEKLATIQAAEYGWDATTTIEQSGADALAEVSFTDLKTGEPAAGFVRAALKQRMNVVTSNKGPIALHYPELSRLAAENSVQIGFEGTVMSGTPVLRMGSEILKAAGVNRIQGILNGTTNYILSRMEDGTSYADALAEAQDKGYAEADPTGDVEGFDAAGKVVILSNLLMGTEIGMDDIERSGITHLTPEDIRNAKIDDRRWKLIGAVEKDGEKVTASVQPVPLPVSHPLATIGGATNAVTFSTDLLGDITLAGPGAGRRETGYALIADLIAIYNKA